MNKKILTMIFDANKGEFIKEALYVGISKEKALVCAVNQFQNNYNTWAYPEKLEGTYKSKVIKHRILFNIDDRFIAYAQEA